jgi:hypothetical protein
MKMKDVICEICGSGDTGTSLEKIEQYEDRVLVTRCYVCDLSYYQEPDGAIEQGSAENKNYVNPFKTGELISPAVSKATSLQRLSAKLVKTRQVKQIDVKK